MRCIDDLQTLNNPAFDDDIHVYPPELLLKKTTECPTTLSYLDVLITIYNGKYSTAVFNKRDSFTFNIVNFPHLSSNILSKPAYGVYISQLVRFGRIRSSFNIDTIRLHKNSSNGFWYSGLCIAFKTFAIVNKYGCSVRKHIEEGICLPAIDGFLSSNICIRS